MIDLDFDFTDTKTVEEVQFKALEDGSYLFVIADAEIKPSKVEDKKPSLKVILASVENEQNKLWENFYLDKSNDISMAYLKDFLAKVYKTELTGTITLDAKDLIGRQIVATVVKVPQTKDPNKFTNNVSFYERVPF